MPADQFSSEFFLLVKCKGEVAKLFPAAFQGGERGKCVECLGRRWTPSGWVDYVLALRGHKSARGRASWWATAIRYKGRRLCSYLWRGKFDRKLLGLDVRCKQVDSSFHCSCVQVSRQLGRGCFSQLSECLSRWHFASVSCANSEDFLKASDIILS